MSFDKYTQSLPMPLVSSRSMDFTTGHWIVDVFEQGAIASGLYLAVPVCDDHEAQIIRDWIAELRKPSPPQETSP